MPSVWLQEDLNGPPSCLPQCTLLAQRSHVEEPAQDGEVALDNLWQVQDWLFRPRVAARQPPDRRLEKRPACRPIGACKVASERSSSALVLRAGRRIRAHAGTRSANSMRRARLHFALRAEWRQRETP